MRLRPLASRPANPRCHGGASSLLRLSSAAAKHWPSVAALKAWAGNSAAGDRRGSKD